MQPDTRRYTALITGCSRGIGLAIARAIAGSCRRLFIVGRDEKQLQAASAQLICDEVIILAGDITKTQFREDIKARVDALGGINLLVNNAGLSDFSAFAEQSPEAIAALLDINLLAPISLTQLLLPQLQQASTAQVINIGSILGYIGHPGYAAYCASKFGLRGFTEALARELSDSHIRVRLFSPRATKTDLNSPAALELNRQLGNTEDSAEDVAKHFLAFLERKEQEYRMGFAEGLFTKVNQMLPFVVSGHMKKQLPKIRLALSVKGIGKDGNNV
jgi:short-subunit dehydrogenase